MAIVSDAQIRRPVHFPHLGPRALRKSDPRDGGVRRDLGEIVRLAALRPHRGERLAGS